MKKPCYLKRLKKCAGTRVLALLVMILLTLEPYVFALSQVVSKYPTGSPTIGSVDMDPDVVKVNTLYYGSVFGFNSAKAMTETTAYAELSEGACIPEGTDYTFLAGMDGWTGFKNNAQFPGGADIGNWESYMYDSTNSAIKTVHARRNVAEKFTWERKFFYDCGTPATVTFALDYKQGIWNLPHATNPKNFQVQLFKPSDTTFAAPISLIGTTDITATSLTTVNGTITTANLNELGTYTLRVVGTLSTANSNGARLEVIFDNINVNNSPQTAYTSFKQDVELPVSAIPLSTTNNYTLEIRAKKASAGAENINVWVYNGIAADTGQGIGWANRATISNTTHTDTSWTAVTDENYAPDYSLALSTAEYNGGNVRVRYIDATPAGDDAQDTLFLDYQRVKVDQGPCVDSVTDGAADCGKCHNYNDDITKPWPAVGYHNKHAQTESISDCLWCHPSDTYTAEHRNGVVEIDGTKIYKAGTTATKGGTGTYDAATTKTCTMPATGCHKGNTSPSWFSVEGVGGFYQNCARCHNNGAVPGDTPGDLHIDLAWPNDVPQGHLKHDVAFNLDEASCQTSGSCHPNNIYQHTVVGDGKVEVVVASVYASPNKTPKYIPDVANGTGTCVNMSCHGGKQTPRFNLANTPPGTGPIDVATNCAACHLAEKADGWGTGAGMASQWISPISGLHRGSPPTSGKSHIADYTCITCHKEPVNHFMTGTVSNLGTGTPLATDMDALLSTDFQTGINATIGTGGTRPNWTTTQSTCSTAVGLTGGGLPCHTEGDTAIRNPGTSWARRWSWDAYDTATPVNQCKSCHGHWNSFATGVVEPHVMSNGDTPLRNALIGGHTDSGDNCGTMCHGQGATLPTPYNHGVAMTAISKDMSLNANANPVNNGTTVGCATACHTNEVTGSPDGGGGNHLFADAAWVTTVNHTDGQTISCFNPGPLATCHGDGVYKSWPTGSPGSYPNRIGEHQIHLDRLATKLGKNLASITQTDQNTMCLYCHNTLAPGLAGHTIDATANQAESSSFKRIFDGAADTATAGTFTAADASCANVDCHNNKATTATFGWRAGSTSTCVMCHTAGGPGNNPTSGLHAVVPKVSGVQHDDSFGVGGTCVNCHNTLPGAATHMNGTFTGDTNLGLQYYTPTGVDTGTCLTSCHKNFSADWAHKWMAPANYSSTTLSCSGCHGNDLTVPSLGTTGVIHRAVTKKHNVTKVDYKCNDCHNLEGTGYTFTFDSNDWLPAGGSSTHGDDQIQVNSSSTAYNPASGYCESCHTSGSFNFSDTSWTIALPAGTPIVSTCTDCHGYPPIKNDAYIPQATEGKGAHQKHVTHIAARASKTLVAATDTFTGTTSAAVCGVCHNVSTVANHTTGGGGPRNMLIPTTYQFGPSVPAYNGVVGTPSSTTLKSCSNLSCHFKSTPAWE